MSILHPILDLTIIAVICASVAGLVIGLGEWKERWGFYQGLRIKLARNRIERRQFQ